jgi:hypothetical protein
MARRSLLEWLDRGNQLAMDHVRSNPDAGLKSLPYAKSDSARRKAVIILAIVGISGLILGWVGALIALVVSAPFFWRLEHHFFVGHQESENEVPKRRP